MKICLLIAAALLLLADVPAQAADTAETILIRQSLEADRSGRRRGDVELIMSVYDEDRFVEYNGGASIDGKGWSVRQDSRDATEAALMAELKSRRYDIQRAIVFINVWKDKAFATTIDSGAVIDVASGTRSPFEESRLWMFQKKDEEWLATSVIAGLGDTTAGPATGSLADKSVAAAVGDLASEWVAGSRSGIVGALSEDVVIVDSYHSSNPAKWLIVFSDREEVDEWLEDRLPLVNREIDRTVEHAVSMGDEAIAVTRDRVRATYSVGGATVEEERVNVYLLSRAGGSWDVTWAWWKTKPYDSVTASLQ